MNRAPLLILFANLKGNVGDFAILHAMLLDLERHYPGHPVHVCSHGQHEVDHGRLKALKETNPPPFEFIGQLPHGRMPRALSILKRIGLSRWLGDRLMSSWAEKFKSIAPVSKAAEYEAMFIEGGDQWSGFSNGTTMFAVMCAMADRNPNMFMYPYSVKSRLLDTYSKERLVSCFAKFAGRLVVRDSNSGDVMRQLRSDVVSGADCAFLLDEVASRLPPAENPEDNLITLAVTSGKGAKVQDIQACALALKQQGYKVRLLTTCEREDAVDLIPISKEIGVEYLAPLAWQDIVMEFKRSALVVTNRLHCMIFTFFADVPLLPLLNRDKVVGVHRDAKLTHAIRDIVELTPAKAAECLRDREKTVAEIRAYRKAATRNIVSPLMGNPGDP